MLCNLRCVEARLRLPCLKLLTASPRQSVTHAHWILESPTKTNNAVCWNFWHKCHTNYYSSFRLELFHQVHYFVSLESTRRVHYPMDLRQLRSTSSTATRRLACLSVPRSRILETSQTSDKSECSTNKNILETSFLIHWKIYPRLCQLMLRTVQTTFIIVLRREGLYAPVVFGTKNMEITYSNSPKPKRKTWILLTAGTIKVMNK